MKKVLELFSAGADGVTPQGSLAADANLRGAAERLGSRSDLFLFLNLERIITEAREDSRKQGRSWAQEQALGLTDVRSLAIGVGLEPRALKLSLALHTKPQARGMMGRLMEPAPPGGFETLRRIPEAVDSCWASRFDLGGVVAAFRDAARADGEAAYDARIQAMSQATGADIDAMLLCLGREIGSYSRPIHRLEASQAETAAETVFVALASPTGLASDLAKLASLLVSSPVRKVEYKPRDYQGISIYAPEVAGGAASPSPRPDNGLAFAVVGDLLVLATPSDEAEYAVRLATGRGESTIMANDSFRQDFPTGGEGLKALYWGDLRKIVEGALRNLRTKPTFLMALGVFARPTLMPSPEAFGEFFDRVVGRARTDGETLSATFEVIYPGKFERQP